MSRRILPRAVLGCVLLAGMLALGSTSATAGRDDPPGDKDANHCLTADGVDLNTLFGIPDQFRTGECRQITAGEHWVSFLQWITDDGVDSVYPPGYVPSRPVPVDDFVAKLVKVKIVVDPGTRRERVQFFTPGQAVRTDITAEQLEPGVWPPGSLMAAILPRAAPVSAGDHTYQVFVVLSAEHCDGFGDDPDLQCVPAGETAFTGVRPLTVTPPDN